MLLAANRFANRASARGNPADFIPLLNPRELDQAARTDRPLEFASRVETLGVLAWVAASGLSSVGPVAQWSTEELRENSRGFLDETQLGRLEQVGELLQNLDEATAAIWVVGDQVLTDGVLAWRFGATYVQLVVDASAEDTRQAVMRSTGRAVAGILFRPASVKPGPSC